MRDTSDETPNLDPPQPREYRRDAWVLLRYVVVPIVVFVALSNLVLGGGAVLRWLDRYRPALQGTSVLINVEKQMLHLEARQQQPVTKPVVAITGSSSVVNAIDSAIIDSIWSGFGRRDAPANYGLTALTAYELPLLKRYLLAPRVRTVVYLYNDFSFSNQYHPDAVGTRFDAAEFLRLFGWRAVLTADFHKGVLGQALFVARYRNLLREMAARAIRGQLVVLTYAYDNPPGEVVRGPWRERKCEPAVPNTEFTRVRHLESTLDTPTVGYRALERFFQLARERGVDVVVAPVPVPEYSACSRYRRGIDPRLADAHVARLARAWNVPYLPWDSMAAFEAHDPYFRDIVHTSDEGRAVYSAWLARQLAGGVLR